MRFVKPGGHRPCLGIHQKLNMRVLVSKRHPGATVRWFMMMRFIMRMVMAMFGRSIPTATRLAKRSQDAGEKQNLRT